MTMLGPFVAAASLFFAYWLFNRYRRISLAHIPGPKPESWLLGHSPQIYRDQAGVADLEWKEKYGGVVRIKGALGEDRLLISDSKALQYIFNTSGTQFVKEWDRQEVLAIAVGRGLVWAEGDIHKRQRHVMQPGFGVPEIKAFVPIFNECAGKITSHWKEAIQSSSNQNAVVNVCTALARATLDAIGEAAFDYKFGALDYKDNNLVDAYSNFLMGLFGVPSLGEVFFRDLLGYIPSTLLSYLVDHPPPGRMRETHVRGAMCDAVSEALIRDKREAALQGKGNRDIMSIMLQSNAGQSQRGKLEDYELIPQMRTLLLAGHETVATTLSWVLFELARHPEMQSRLRAEVRAYEGEWDMKALEAMPYLVAFVKEVLRFEPVAHNAFRQAARDVRMPLSTPLVSTKGELLETVVVPKDTRVVMSIVGYNRDKSLWGDDADIFNPDRWLRASFEKKGTSVGVYGNLLSFGASNRACIGWRFAVAEMHAFVAELVSNFEFGMTPEAECIRRDNCSIVVPTVEGEVHKGEQLPLRISIVSRE